MELPSSLVSVGLAVAVVVLGLGLPVGSRGTVGSHIAEELGAVGFEVLSRIRARQARRRKG